MLLHKEPTLRIPIASTQKLVIESHVVVTQDPTTGNEEKNKVMEIT